MERDCRLCFYYTWEQRLLCAVEPSLVGNACECRHYDYDDSRFVENGIVVKDAYDLGFALAVAVELLYEWEDHYEGDRLIRGMIVVSYNAYDQGFAPAQQLPYEWEDHYEGDRLIRGMIVVSQGVGNSEDGWFRPAVELPTSCYINELLFEDYNFSESNFVEGVVVGHSLWRDRRNGQVVGYAEAWLIEYRHWYENPDPLSLQGGFVIEFMSLFE